MRNGERVQLVPKTKDPKALVEATRRISATLTPMVCSLPDCLRNPCKNNATCVETLSGYTCTCAPYTSGTNCETGTACMSNPCTNNATCVETLPGYTCTCAPYFSGTHCETGTACLSNPCTNNATCVETLPGYTCTCAPYFSGTHCETGTACLSNPCTNNGTCVETLPGYKCICAPYFLGTHCETGTACLSNPCMNSATCVETLPGYTCTCAPYFSGTHCETGTACLSNPCMNYATCVETLPGYTCTCAPFSSGTLCQTDDCPPNWILGNGKCYLFTGLYKPWQDAKDYCANLNGVYSGNAWRYPSLLYIDDAAETGAFLAILLRNTHFWLNCNDIAQEGVWTCQRDRYGTPGSYRNWRSGSPGIYNCAYIHHEVPSGDWQDNISCSTAHEVVCRITVD